MSTDAVIIADYEEPAINNCTFRIERIDEFDASRGPAQSAPNTSHLKLVWSPAVQSKVNGLQVIQTTAVKQLKERICPESDSESDDDDDDNTTTITPLPTTTIEFTVTTYLEKGFVFEDKAEHVPKQVSAGTKHVSVSIKNWPFLNKTNKLGVIISAVKSNRCGATVYFSQWQAESNKTASVSVMRPAAHAKVENAMYILEQDSNLTMQMFVDLNATEPHLPHTTTTRPANGQSTTLAPSTTTSIMPVVQEQIQFCVEHRAELAHNAWQKFCRKSNQCKNWLEEVSPTQKALFLLVLLVLLTSCVRRR